MFCWKDVPVWTRIILECYMMALVIKGRKFTNFLFKASNWFGILRDSHSADYFQWKCVPNAKSAVLQCLKRFMNIRERKRINVSKLLTSYTNNARFFFPSCICIYINLKWLSQTSPKQMRVVVMLTVRCPHLFLALEKTEQVYQQVIRKG